MKTTSIEMVSGEKIKYETRLLRTGFAGCCTRDRMQ